MDIWEVYINICIKERVIHVILFEYVSFYLFLNYCYNKAVSHFVQKMATLSSLIPMSLKRTDLPHVLWFIFPLFQIRFTIQRQFFPVMLYEWKEKPTIRVRTRAEGSAGCSSLECGVFFAAFGSVVPAGLSCQVDREVKRWRDNTGWQTTSVSDVQTCDPKCYMITPERITWLSRHWNLDFWIWEFKDVGYKRVCWPAVSSLWRLVSFFLCFPLWARIPSLQWLTPRSGF